MQPMRKLRPNQCSWEDAPIMVPAYENEQHIHGSLPFINEFLIVPLELFDDCLPDRLCVCTLGAGGIYPNPSDIRLGGQPLTRRIAKRNEI